MAAAAAAASAGASATVPVAAVGFAERAQFNGRARRERETLRQSVRLAASTPATVRRETAPAPSPQHGPAEARRRDEQERRLADPSFALHFHVKDGATMRLEAARDAADSREPFRGGQLKYTPRPEPADAAQLPKMQTHFRAKDGDTLRREEAADRAAAEAEARARMTLLERLEEASGGKDERKARETQQGRRPPFRAAFRCERNDDLRAAALLSTSGEAAPYTGSVEEALPRELDSDSDLVARGQQPFRACFHAASQRESLGGAPLPPVVTVAEREAAESERRAAAAQLTQFFRPDYSPDVEDANSMTFKNAVAEFARATQELRREGVALPPPASAPASPTAAARAPEQPPEMATNASTAPARPPFVTCPRRASRTESLGARRPLGADLLAASENESAALRRHGSAPVLAALTLLREQKEEEKRQRGEFRRNFRVSRASDARLAATPAPAGPFVPPVRLSRALSSERELHERYGQPPFISSVRSESHNSLLRAQEVHSARRSSRPPSAPRSPQLQQQQQQTQTQPQPQPQQSQPQTPQPQPQRPPASAPATPAALTPKRGVPRVVELQLAPAAAPSPAASPAARQAKAPVRHVGVVSATVSYGV